MWRFIVLGASFLVLGGGSAWPSERDKKPEALKEYAVSCNLIYELAGSDSDGKPARRKIETKMPNITTLQGTRAEYFAGGKLSSTPYGFQLHVKIKPMTEKTVRLEVTAENSSASGS